MPKFHIAKAVEIAAPVSEVFATVRDFRSWPSWSPWLIAERECEVSFDSDGKGYQWEGEVVGSGQMKIVGEAENEEITYELQFLKPWKSRADVAMKFSEETKDGAPMTRVVWEMDSSLPIFMAWMKKSMTAFIGMDYERGLAMLRDKLERGMVPSALEFSTHSLDACRFVGIRTKCEIETLGPSMEGDIASLDEWMGKIELKPQGALRSFYHKWDAVHQVVEYSIGYPVAEVPDQLPPGTVLMELPAMDTYAVIHTGCYAHLGNAWSAGVMHGRAKKFKQRRGIHPFEIYESNRDETPPEQLVTTVHFPLK